MLTLTGTLKSIFAGRTTPHRNAASSRQTEQLNDPAAAALRDAQTNAQAAEADEEATFLKSIAQLPTDERQKRIARREWYRQLAERQGIVEAEHKADQNLWR